MPPSMPLLAYAASLARLSEDLSAGGTLTCDVPSAQEQFAELSRPPRVRSLNEARAAHDRIVDALMRRRGMHERSSIKTGRPLEDVLAEATYGCRPQGSSMAAAPLLPRAGSEQQVAGPPTPQLPTSEALSARHGVPRSPTARVGMPSDVQERIAAALADSHAPAEEPAFHLAGAAKTSPPGSTSAPLQTSTTEKQTDDAALDSEASHGTAPPGAQLAHWPDRYLAYQYKVVRRELEAAEIRVRAAQVPPQLHRLLHENDGERRWAALSELRVPARCNGAEALRQLKASDVPEALMRGNFREQQFLCVRFYDMLLNAPGLVVLMQVQAGQEGTQDWAVHNPQRFGPWELEVQCLEPRLMGLSYAQPQRLPAAPAARKMFHALQTLLQEGHFVGRSSYSLRPTKEDLREAATNVVMRKMRPTKEPQPAPKLLLQSTAAAQECADAVVDAALGSSTIPRSPSPPIHSPMTPQAPLLAEEDWLTGPLGLGDAPWANAKARASDNEEDAKAPTPRATSPTRVSLASPTLIPRASAAHRSFVASKQVALQGIRPEQHSQGPQPPRPGPGPASFPEATGRLASSNSAVPLTKPVSSRRLPAPRPPPARTKVGSTPASAPLPSPPPDPTATASPPHRAGAPASAAREGRAIGVDQATRHVNLRGLEARRLRGAPERGPNAR